MLGELGRWLFDPSGLTAHGFCLSWEPGLIWTHAVSDIAIGIAYYSIPLALMLVVRRREDLIFRPLFWLFAAFILLCGTVHWLDVLTLWVPAYGLQGLVKAATAVASVTTAIALWKFLPQAITLPSPAQLRQAGDALRESEARHRASFERSPVPLHTLDSGFAITGVSDSWLALLGYARDEVIGHQLSEFIAPGTELWEGVERERLMKDGEIHEIERRFVRSDGAIVDALISARLDRHNGLTGIVCALIDITARRRAEEALRSSEERLRQAQKMEAVGQLTGGIAHDFNNILHGIGGCLELMERRIAQHRSEEVGRYIQEARLSVNRASALTSRMLAFARRQSLQPLLIEPDSLVRGIEDLIRRTMGPSIQVEVGLHDGLLKALCDQNELETALLNLAINARDAMPDGGTLTISTADRILAPADVAEHEGAKPGSYVQIAVRDTGMGMPPDDVQRAFEPFFTTKPTGQGTGLGLSQVYGFVRQSGGLVQLESAPGQGTTVRFFIPGQAGGVAEPSEGPYGATRTDNRTAFGVGAAVLVVEDDKGVRTLIVEALREWGCIVLEAEDGPSGLRIIQSQVDIDLLITDVGLPGLNGRQLAEATRVIRPDLPVILVTGYAGAAFRDMELDEGVEILKKPFSLEYLEERISSVLGRSRQRPETPKRS